MIQQILVSAYFAALVVPFLFLLSGSFARKLVRGRPWEQKDFYLGVEATLSAMSAGLIYLFDLARSPANLKASALKISTVTTSTPAQSTSTGSGNAIGATAGFIAVTFFILLWMLAVHQDWEKDGLDSKKKRFRLAILCPLVGAGLMAAFIILIKGA